MKRIGLIAGVIIVLAIVGLALAQRGSGGPAANNTLPAPGSAAPAASPSQSAATITYDSSGFHPSSTAVKYGNSVTFVNKSSEDIQVDSNPHPVHTDDTDLNVGVIAPGQSKTVVLTKKGSFGFHNHLDPSEQGRITIE